MSGARSRCCGNLHNNSCASEIVFRCSYHADGVGYTVDDTQSSGAPELNSTSPFMPQPVAGSAKGHQVFRLIGSPLLSRHDVMDFQEPGPPAARGLATVLVPCQHFPAHAWRDGCCVPASVFTDRGIAAHSFGLGPAQLALARVGLDGHSARFWVFVNVDLDGRTAGKGPPGGPRLCRFMRVCHWVGFVRDFFTCFNSHPCRNFHTCFNFYTCRSFHTCCYFHTCRYLHA